MREVLPQIDGRRLDVVTDSEFLEPGVAVRVTEVESTRVVVEPLEDTADEVD